MSSLNKPGVKISAEQLRIIETAVVRSGITIDTLRDDLIDHLCCDIENKMRLGKTFEPAFADALTDLAPGGLLEIEHKTQLLLNTKKIVMKKVFYFITMATMISFTMGIMMKLLHMRGGEQLINYGFISFSVIYLPSITIQYFKEKKTLETINKLKMLSGFASAILICMAVWFKLIMNLEPSALSLMIGVSIFSFGYLPLHFYELYKKSMQPA